MSSRPLTRLVRFAAGLLVGLGFGPLAEASVPKTPPAEIPQTWLVYAGQAGQSLSAWLSSDRPPPPVAVAIWIGVDGTVTRADGPFPEGSSAKADLHDLLVGHRLPSSPPPDMLQPLRLRLQLEPAPTDALPDSPGIMP
jgi:hypothetical protein